MAVPQVVRRFAALGGTATLRAGVLTDNGHPLLDVRGLAITDPLAHGGRDQPVARRRDGGHLRPPPRQRLPAGHGRRACGRWCSNRGPAQTPEDPLWQNPTIRSRSASASWPRRRRRKRRNGKRPRARPPGLPPVADEPEEARAARGAGSTRLKTARRGRARARTIQRAGSTASARSCSSGHGVPVACAATRRPSSGASVRPRAPSAVSTNRPGSRGSSRAWSSRWPGARAAGSGRAPAIGSRSSLCRRQPTRPWHERAPPAAAQAGQALQALQVVAGGRGRGAASSLGSPALRVAPHSSRRRAAAAHSRRRPAAAAAAAARRRRSSVTWPRLCCQRPRRCAQRRQQARRTGGVGQHDDPAPARPLRPPASRSTPAVAVALEGGDRRCRRRSARPGCASAWRTQAGGRDPAAAGVEPGRAPAAARRRAAPRRPRSSACT